MKIARPLRGGRHSPNLFHILSAVVLAATGCGPSGPGEGGDELQKVQSSQPLASGSLQADTIATAMRKHDEAKARAAADPIVLPAVARLTERRTEHGMSGADTFRIRSVNVDEEGGRHVRLDHLFRGIRVLGSAALIRTTPDGETRDEQSHGLRRDIALDTRPQLSEAEARAVVGARPERIGAPLLESRAELVIFPVTQRFVKATGALVTGKEEGLNALDVERRVVAYKLAYQIDTVDRSENGPSPRRFLVDAVTGEVLQVRSLMRHVQGTGWTCRTDGPNNDYHVPLSTFEHNSTNFEPKDSYRNFGVWDDDYGDNSGPNWDMNNFWGDGKAFAGDDTATFQNRQTAIAEVMYGMQGTWDMFARVWNRHGYDNAYYDGHAYVHVGTEWDGASYNLLTGNISVGDSSGTRSSIRTGYDTVAHEFGHGMDDFTADIGGNGEADGIAEASADIIAQVSEAYEKGLGLQNGLTTIPSSPGPDWDLDGSGRSFKIPAVSYWYSGLENDYGEYDIASLMDHAFYFLSQGSSSNPYSHLWSSYLPWGMRGIGIDHAARIWIRALFTGFTGNQDFADARASCLTAAAQLYGSSSAEYRAVQNAFGAIGVGSVAAGQPAGPVSMSETESNNTEFSADPVSFGTLPAGAPVTGSLYTRTVVSGGVSSTDTADWFSIAIPSGRTLRVTLFPWNDADIEIYDGWDTLVDRSANGGTASEQVVAPAPADGYVHPYNIRVYHYFTVLGQLPFYSMYVDVY